MSIHAFQGVAALFMALCLTCLSACSGGGGGGGAPDTAPPTFGGAALALALTDTSIDVQWAAATDNLDPSSAILYNVYLSQVSGGQNLSVPDVTTPPGATSQGVGSLLAGTTYFFIVRAEDTSGNEDTNLVEVMATTLAMPDTTPPMFIGVASAMALSPTGIQLDWAAATDDTALPSQILYNIYWATISGGQSFIAPNDTTPPGTTSHVATGLLPDTEYFFVVRAEDPSGNEDTNLVELSATTLPDSTPPIFGGATGAMALSDTMIEVSWAAATDDSDPASAIVYNLYMALVSGGQNFAVPTNTSAPGATMHIIGGLLPFTDYFVVVRA